MTQQLLNILNPVRRLTVAEWIQIAEIIQYKSDKYYDKGFDVTRLIFVKLMQRLEELTKKQLTKKDFVCEVEQPKLENYGGGYSMELLKQFKQLESTYEAAQREVIFEGFEKLNDESVHVSGHLFIVGNGYLFVETNRVYQATLFDLIYHVTKYNETATTKIELKFTPDFVNKLLNNG